MRLIVCVFSILFGFCAVNVDGPRHTCGVSDHECHRKFFQRFGSYYSKIASTLCSIYDSLCQRDYFQQVGRNNAYKGFPTLGIPVIDPYQLKNVTTSIFGLWNLTLVRGEAEGIQKCTLLNYTSDMNTRIKIPEIICDPIIIRGHYRLTPSWIVEETCSLNYRADGNIVITINDWYFKFVYPFKIVRHSDGKIYVEAVFEKAKYTASYGKVTVQADGIKYGNWDISELATCLINKYWRVIVYSDIGKFINDQSAIYYYNLYDTFFDLMPASAYYSDNFTSLVEN